MWWPLVLAPLARGTIVVLDVYSSALYGSNAAALITPEPKVIDERLPPTSPYSRVTWWIPGEPGGRLFGDRAEGVRHAAILLINGASERGNDDSESRRISEALARAGYLVMLPEYEFLKEARLDRTGPSRVDAAFAALLARPDVDPDRVGAFGFSVGGGMLFAAAAIPGGSLRRARYLGALGAYFDIRTYLASVVSGVQVRPGGREKWTPDPEARLKLPVGAAQALDDPRDRDRVVATLRASGGVLTGDPPTDLGPDARALWLALAATDYDTALARIDALPASLRTTFVGLSPSARWSELRIPVYWLHDEGDRFEPVSEAERASATPHSGTTRLQLTKLLSHAAALGPDAQKQGPDFLFRELAGLLGFSFDVLKRAG